MSNGRTFSNSRVDRAGETIRRTLRSPNAVELVHEDEYREALDVARTHRAEHSVALVTANNGLRSCLGTLGLAGEVSQRLKRWQTIQHKLLRFDSMKLSRMQDIRGCRAVLADRNDVEVVRDRFVKNSRRRNRKDDTIRDYVSAPQASGYRAVHIHTTFRGRRIEVQLRTRRQHRWAIMVERLSLVIGEDLKSGLGPQEVLDLLVMAGDGLAIEESGYDPDETFMKEFASLVKTAEPWLGGK